jgi:hypothetical protein
MQWSARENEPSTPADVVIVVEMGIATEEGHAPDSFAGIAPAATSRVTTLP